ncbi:unknown [Halorubrum sp. DM2]|uniref:Sjogren's syndrome/scleroderma autoantigen 1 family protein n=1 Tax=Halorubrum sp. DM2 TaxID=2527867 RepID=UPI0024B73A6A|nr:Sjogren's syndrome/scleroderma autoantigen 1 family protein [Halorubrum sp. DM2]VTT85228.1 unknown [Halorubrum sp. DM2]
MSDGFDKEAEREKLREKFADDEQKREHTQRMSELLLKGATMTNRHCDNCGDPIFRHDGREFCPTCGNEAGGAPGADAGETPADAATESPAGANAAPEGGVDAADAGAVSDAATPADAAEPARSNSGVEAVSSGVGAVDSGASGSGESPPSPPAAAPSRSSEPERSGSRRPESSRSASPGSADDAGGIDAARASLTRTLTRFARAAEETDDPRRARDHLEAAREAAEALAALD